MRRYAEVVQASQRSTRSVQKELQRLSIAIGGAPRTKRPAGWTSADQTLRMRTGSVSETDDTPSQKKRQLLDALSKRRGAAQSAHERTLGVEEASSSSVMTIPENSERLPAPQGEPPPACSPAASAPAASTAPAEAPQPSGSAEAHVANDEAAAGSEGGGHQLC